MDKLNELAIQTNAFESIDNSVFQRKARIMQSLWRIQKGYPAGLFRDRKLGSTLEMPWAQETLANYLDETIRQVVRCEVLDTAKNQGKLYGKPRIFNNMLSSQPLVFNLFSHLKVDLELASQVFYLLTKGRCQKITDIQFEHSPGRGDQQFTGDHSAFDVYFEYLTAAGTQGFIGIEVKYHENLCNEASDHHDRYDQIALKAGCFEAAQMGCLKAKPLQQIWRDHLLALSLLHTGLFGDGFFVFLSPQDNLACSQAVSRYRQCLTCQSSFVHWTLESIVQTIQMFVKEPWITEFFDRYLNFSKIQTSML